MREAARLEAFSDGVMAVIITIMAFSAWTAGVGLAWLTPWIAYSLYGAVALLWFVPDRRLSSHETV